MKPPETSRIIDKIQNVLQKQLTLIGTPPQGMDGIVFFIQDQDGKQYAVKVARNLRADLIAFKLIKDANLNIPIPEIHASFEFENKQVVVYERINYPLLESVPKAQMGEYIASMINTLKEIHKIKSNDVYNLSSPNDKTTWKDYLLNKFNSKTSDLNWFEISERKGLDKKLILLSVDKIQELICNTQLLTDGFSLLHTDFNQRNLFVDPESKRISGVIDWSEAVFGDPIYDFARVRMLIWHFDLEEGVVENYYKLLNYTPEERKLDDLYWLCRVIEYLAYYSEELNDFNVGRIKLHQEFLRDIDQVIKKGFHLLLKF